MQKGAERADSHAAGDGLVAGTVHIPGPHEHVRYSEPLAVLGDDLVLPGLGEAIGVPPELRTLFDRARLVEQASPPVSPARVHHERADADESTQARVPQARVE